MPKGFSEAKLGTYDELQAQASQAQKWQVRQLQRPLKKAFALDFDVVKDIITYLHRLHK